MLRALGLGIGIEQAKARTADRKALATGLGLIHTIGGQAHGAARIDDGARLDAREHVGGRDGRGQRKLGRDQAHGRGFSHGIGAMRTAIGHFSDAGMGVGVGIAACGGQSIQSGTAGQRALKWRTGGRVHVVAGVDGDVATHRDVAAHRCGDRGRNVGPRQAQANGRATHRQAEHIDLGAVVGAREHAQVARAAQAGASAHVGQHIGADVGKGEVGRDTHQATGHGKGVHVDDDVGLGLDGDVAHRALPCAHPGVGADAGVGVGGTTVAHRDAREGRTHRHHPTLGTHGQGTEGLLGVGIDVDRGCIVQHGAIGQRRLVGAGHRHDRHGRTQAHKAEAKGEGVLVSLLLQGAVDANLTTGPQGASRRGPSVVGDVEHGNGRAHTHQPTAAATHHEVKHRTVQRFEAQVSARGDAGAGFDNGLRARRDHIGSDQVAQAGAAGALGVQAVGGRLADGAHALVGAGLAVVGVLGLVAAQQVADLGVLAAALVGRHVVIATVLRRACGLVFTGAARLFLGGR